MSNMNERIKNLVQEFKVKKRRKKIEPYYLISFEMDSNDGDYMRDSCEVSEEEWKMLHPAVLLGLLYFGNGYSGKFSHGKTWGDYYGHHWEDNKHGLSELVEILVDDLDLMCNTDWERCHSYTDINIEYFDESGKKCQVDHPSIDDLFDTEEEMVSTIQEAMKDYYKQNEDS